MDKMWERLLLEILKKIDAEQMVKDFLESAKLQLMCYVKLVVDKSATPIDNAIVQILAQAMGVDLSKCPVHVEEKIPV